MIEIADTGPGIPAELQAQVFDPVFTTKPIGVGTGLGLSICMSIVNAAGGTIALDSPSGGGCRVSVSLPASAARVEVAPQAPSVGRRLRLLLVEDEAGVRRTLHRLLEGEHEVEVAEDGERALERLKSNRVFDAVLCDVMMPRMTGVELYQSLHGIASPHANRMIFMTGGAFSRSASEFVSRVGRPLLEKPIDKNALWRALASAAEVQ